MEQHIRVFENVAPVELCKQVIAKYEEGEFVPREGNCPNKTVMPADDELTLKLYDIAWNTAKKYFEDYWFEEFEGCYVLDHMVYSCYEVGTFYKTHTDSNFEDGKCRTVSCILYLNEDFEGGELIFPRENIVIKPKEASIAIFPTGYLLPHSVNIGTSRRHTVAFFFYKVVDHNEVHFKKELEGDGSHY